MQTIFQSSDKNPRFSFKGSGQFGNVLRTGWSKTRLGSTKQKLIAQYLQNSNVDQVYKRGNNLFAFFLNGTETQIS